MFAPFWERGAYYRWVFLSQYAAKDKFDHPRSVYLREDQILPRLDDWLTTKFSPDTDYRPGARRRQGPY
jgi:hypothetical protein